MTLLRLFLLPQISLLPSPAPAALFLQAEILLYFPHLHKVFSSSISTHPPQTGSALSLSLSRLSPAPRISLTTVIIFCLHYMVLHICLPHNIVTKFPTAIMCLCDCYMIVLNLSVTKKGLVAL